MPPVILIEYPQVNGHRFSWNSIEIRMNGIRMLGIKSLNYKAKLTPGLVRGAGNPNPIGRTAGEAEYTADFEILRIEFENLARSLGSPAIGLGEAVFPITCKFFEAGSPVVLDSIPSFRGEEFDFSNAQGADASTVKVSGGSLNIAMNGSPLVTPRFALL